MIDLTDEVGQLYVIHEPHEAREEGFLSLRARIFDVSGKGVGRISERIFRDESWVRVIVRGALMGSDRSRYTRERAEELDALEFFDPRDELQPIFDILAEDGVDEIIHMRPWGKDEEQDAVITRPARSVLNFLEREAFAMCDTDRLVFDRTGRWGFYGSVEEFGLIGGEPELMDRYVEKAGGMAFIREKADIYWQAELDEDGWEADDVSHYYKLAGWDNPPVRRGVNTEDQ